MYDSLTGGFSGGNAQNSAGGVAAGGGSGGGAGGAGGASSGRGPGRSSRSSARNQLVTSVTSRDVREKYEIERSQLGHGHYGVVRRCWDKQTREVSACVRSLVCGARRNSADVPSSFFFRGYVFFCVCKVYGGEHVASYEGRQYLLLLLCVFSFYVWCVLCPFVQLPPCTKYGARLREGSQRC